jgi:hypothetical protein
MLSVCLCIPFINFWMPELIFMKLCMYIMAPEPISTAYVVNPCHQSMRLYVYTPIVDRQRLSKNVTAATYTHAAIEEFLDASFSLQSVSYQRKVGERFFPELLVTMINSKLSVILYTDKNFVEGRGTCIPTASCSCCVHYYTDAVTRMQ